MPPRTLHPAALRAQLLGLVTRLRESDAPVVAFRGDAWDGPEAIDVGGRTWHVKACRSALEVREVLSSNDVGRPLVILTQLDRAELGADVTARLIKGRVLDIDPWEPVLRAFGAHRIDARLANYKWLPGVLFSGMADRYPQAASGTLDAATAWRFAFKILLGVDPTALDITTLLEWTFDAPVLSRWKALPADQATDISKWLTATVGPSAELPLALITSGHGSDAVPVAIVCAVLFAGEDEPSGVRGAAAVRLERSTGGLRVDAHRGRALAAVAEGLLARLVATGHPGVPALVGRADHLLGELGASSEAWSSRWLPTGFDQRLQRYAEALTQALEGSDAAAALAATTLALEGLRGHSRAAAEPERITRAEQALRLVRYIRTVDHETQPGSFGETVAAYSTVDAYADVARYALYASETHQAFGAALAAVADRAAMVREAFTETFAGLAKHWFEAPSATPSLIYIEDVLKSVVAPLASKVPVLLIVADGMSAAVSDTLGASIERRGWANLGP